MEKLAIEGGKPVIEDMTLPTVRNITGRDIGKEELKAVREVLESGIVDPVHGEKTRQFEKEFAAKFGVKHAIASNSGSAAVHVAVTALNINPGDEIITTPLTDMGTILGILYQNAIPVFADIDPLSYNIHPESIKSRITNKTKAIIVVHLVGHPCDMDPIMKTARENNLCVIEDCAQSFLSLYKGKIVGTTGDLGAFSFRYNKHMTTGLGGMTITNDDALAERCRLCSDKGLLRTPGEGFVHYIMLAPNYVMSELQAAVGIAQLKKLDRVVERRQKGAQLLSSLVESIEGVTPPYVGKFVTHTYFSYVFKIDRNRLGVSVEEFAKALTAEGIESYGRYYGHRPLYLSDMLKKKNVYGNSRCPFDCPLYGKEMVYKKGLCPTAESVLEEMVTLPWTETYTEEHIHKIAEGIGKVARHYLTTSKSKKEG